MGKEDEEHGRARTDGIHGVGGETTPVPPLARPPLRSSGFVLVPQARDELRRDREGNLRQWLVSFEGGWFGWR